jgi:hypothetical protein
MQGCYATCGDDPANRAFSDIVTTELEGDRSGWRMQLIQGKDSAYALVQGFEGVPLEPCLVPASVKGDGSIEFVLPTSCSSPGTFRGIVRNGHIVGVFNNGMTGPRGERLLDLRELCARAEKSSKKGN